MAETDILCPHSEAAGGSCMDTVDVPGDVIDTYRETPDELDEETAASLNAHLVTTCSLCEDEYTVEYEPR